MDAIVTCKLSKKCERCGGSVHLSDIPHRHQVYELPKIKLNVTEYQCEKGRCRSCGYRQMANLPEGVNQGITGPALTSFMSLLVSTISPISEGIATFFKKSSEF